MIMTMGDLRKILIDCAGEADGSVLDGDIRDIEFDKLGYDSLALMETAARIKSTFGVILPDERIAELRTPGEILDLVNS